MLIKWVIGLIPPHGIEKKFDIKFIIENGRFLAKRKSFDQQVRWPVSASHFAFLCGSTTVKLSALLNGLALIIKKLKALHHGYTVLGRKDTNLRICVRVVACCKCTGGSINYLLSMDNIILF